MKKLVFLMIFVFFVGLQAWAADDYPKGEITGGFAFVSDVEWMPGWYAGAAYNFHPNVGLVGEISGVYKTILGVDTSMYFYLFGPRFNFRTERATFFVHALFGGMSVKVASLSENNFAGAFGGGVDINAGKSIAIRVAQADLLYGKSGDAWARDFRYMGGIVFKFGGQ